MNPSRDLKTNDERPSPEKPGGVEGQGSGNRCVDCGGWLVQDFGRGEVHCGTCGIVVEDQIIDSGPDWRAFDSEQRASKERTGAPLSLMQHDLGLGTAMWGRVDAHGRGIPQGDALRIRRMQKWDRRARYKRGADRNLASALTEIRRMGTTIGVPKHVLEEASRIYRQAAQKNLIRGRSIDSVAAASLYAALRKGGVPRSLEEIAEVSSSGKREIGRVYKVVASELKLSLSPISPASFVPRFASRLTLSSETESRANEIVQGAVAAEIVSGKDPKSVAAGAIYIASVLAGEARTQRDVSAASGVTEVTVRNRYKELVEALSLTFDFGT